MRVSYGKNGTISKEQVMPLHRLIYLALILLSATLVACGSTQPPTPGNAPAGAKKFRIGMSQANNAEPWRTAMNAQIAAAAAQHPEFEVTFTDAKQNNAQQVTDVEQFISSGVDLLIISPNEATPLTNVVAKAYDKGIPVIVLDRKVNGDKYTMWIGADNKLIGRKAGEYVATWCKAQNHAPCSVIELRGLEGSTPALERGDGFREGIATNPDVKIVASQNADWVYEKAVPLAEAMLKANAAVDVIYGHNDPMGEAAITAAKNVARDLGKTLVLGIDALPTPDGGIQSVLKNRLNVTYVYPTGGTQAIEWAAKILETKTTPPKEVVLETEEITSANATAIYQKYGGK